MTKDRILALEAGKAKLNEEELRQNWHFCPDFDYGLTQGEQRTDEGACDWCGYDWRDYLCPMPGEFE